jgi:hypothetical protein
MTTLLMAEDAVPGQLHGHPPALGLQQCLQGHWALLFSNPEDFAPHPSTPAGFMRCVADDLQRARTRAFAVAHRLEQSPPNGWLQQVTADVAPGRSLIVLECGANGGRVVDLATRALAHKLRQLATPYVLVLDEHGRCRSTISYRARRIDRPRSLTELLCMVVALRGDGRVDEESAGRTVTRTRQITP